MCKPLPKHWGNKEQDDHAFEELRAHQGDRPYNSAHEEGEKKLPGIRGG